MRTGFYAAGGGMVASKRYISWLMSSFQALTLVNQGIVKWLWGSFGLGICAIPVFFKIPGVHSFDLGSRTEGKNLSENTARLLKIVPRIRNKSTTTSICLW